MNRSTLLLFDVDGTLTAARQPIDKDFEQFLLRDIRSKFTIGLVGGSDFNKIAEQMNGTDFVHNYDYVFPENGLIQYKNGKEVGRVSITNEIELKDLENFEKFALNYIEKLQLPFKRSVFIERRTGLINISPVGRTCTVDERNLFEEYDRIHNIRKAMINELKKEFAFLNLNYVIGGQISFDVYPIGWDKSYCLRHIDGGFAEIHFFGDKTYRGGNDYEIFVHEKVIGHSVTSPEDTRNQLLQLLHFKMNLIEDQSMIPTTKISLDPITNSQIEMILLTNVSMENLEQIQALKSSEFDFTVIKTDLLYDCRQVVTAANKAALSRHYGQMITKNVHTEFIFNLSMSRNINDTLAQFTATTTRCAETLLLSALVVQIRSLERHDVEQFDKLMELISAISGYGNSCGHKQQQIWPIEDLSRFSKISLIKDFYKISDDELKVSSLTNSIVSRIATKNII